MKDKLEEAIKDAADKVKSAKSGDEAMKYAQSALNSAHALAVVAALLANAPN